MVCCVTGIKSAGIVGEMPERIQIVWGNVQREKTLNIGHAVKSSSQFAVSAIPLVLPIQSQSIMHAKVKNEFFALINIAAMFRVQFRLQLARSGRTKIDSTKWKMKSHHHELTHFKWRTSGLFTRRSNEFEEWMFQTFSPRNVEIFSLDMIAKWTNGTRIRN